MIYKISKKRFEKNNIEVPEGYRLIKSWELLKLSQEDEQIEKLLVDSYVWASWKKGIRACWLYSFGDDSIFSAGNRDVNNNGGLRGVFVKEEVKND